MTCVSFLFVWNCSGSRQCSHCKLWSMSGSFWYVWPLANLLIQPPDLPSLHEALGFLLLVRFGALGCTVESAKSRCCMGLFLFLWRRSGTICSHDFWGLDLELQVKDCCSGSKCTWEQVWPQCEHHICFPSSKPEGFRHVSRLPSSSAKLCARMAIDARLCACWISGSHTSLYLVHEGWRASKNHVYEEYGPPSNFVSLHQQREDDIDQSEMVKA